MMKRLLFLAIVSAAIPSAFASEPSDTIEDLELDEIVIEAPKVIHKADMDLYKPSKSAVEYSKNGIQLLRNLMIPTITVNEALGSISAAGQPVQVRINGREATIDQVKSLLPESIKRVEWIDNPGLRYGGADHVLNFIVVNPTVGGSLMAQAKPALNCGWGYYQADVKFNYGRSQWEFGGNIRVAEGIKAHRDYTETFRWEDGTELTRRETPLDGQLDNTQGVGQISYNYIKPDTTVFNVQLVANSTISDLTRYDGLLSLSNGDKDILLSDESGRVGTTPRFSVYLEQHLAHRQTFVVDFSASLYSGRSHSSYLERYAEGTDYITDVNTDIKDRNQAYGLEADYIKQWRSSKLTTGASYTANRNRSVYENLGGEIFHQRQDKAYFFMEYFQRISKVTLTGGLGVQYTSFRFLETDQGNHSWNLRPQATVTYSLNQNHNFRLSFASWQSTPSLAEINMAPQQLDGFQWRIGNSNLKTSSSYMLTLRYGHNLFDQRVSGTLGVRAFTSPDAITPYLYWEEGRLITSYENSKGLQNLTVWLADQIQIIPDRLMLSGSIQYRAERMKGKNYTHYNHGWSGDATLIFMYKGFQFVFQYEKAQRDLWGEKISWGEDLNIIAAAYNWKNWQFEAGMLIPFGKYDRGSKSLSQWNRNEHHMRVDMRVPYISITYNLKWGHQKRGANKLINADAEVEHSTTGGR